MESKVKSSGAINVRGNARNVNTGVSIKYQHYSGIFVNLEAQSNQGRHLFPPAPYFDPRPNETYLSWSPERPGIGCLPLRDISVDVDVQECIARTTLVQDFWNPNDKPIKNASYQFPMARGAVLESLRCVMDEEVTMEGQIKTRGEARAVFKKAERQHHPATLMEATPEEMIEFTLAHISPESTVKVELVYLSRLRYEAGKGAILVVPRYIAPPVRSTPVDTTNPTQETSLVLKVHIRALVPISKVQSEHHPISVQIGSTHAVQEASSCIPSGPTEVIVAFDSMKTDLMNDFVLIIETSKDPLAILGNCPEGDISEAIILEFSSDHLFSKTPAELHPTEYVLVIDSPCDSMIQGPPWTRSRHSRGNDNSRRGRSGLYSVAGLDHMMQQTRRVYHNTRNTDLVRTLGIAVDQRNRTSTTHVIILMVCDRDHTLQGAIDFVESDTTKIERHVHFSVIGFGDSLPGHIVAKMEHLSHGRVKLLSLASGADEVGAAVTDIIGAVLPWKLEIYVDDIPQPDYYSLARALQLSAGSDEDLVQGAISQYEQMMYTQTPHRLDLVPHSARQSIFLLSHKGYARRPSFITINATAISGDILTRKIPITTSSMEPGSIHRLAAKSIMDDLEGDQSFLHEMLGPRIFLNNGLKQEIERHVERIGTDLGLQWSVMGRWTSFVAVDHSEPSSLAHNIYKSIKYSAQVPNDPRFINLIWDSARRLVWGCSNWGCSDGVGPLPYGWQGVAASCAEDSEYWYSSSSEEGSSQDFSESISQSRQRKPEVIYPLKRVTRLKVTDATEEDSSQVGFSRKIREAFDIQPNDIVLLSGGRQRTAAKRVAPTNSEGREQESVGLSTVARQNAGLQLGQMVTIHKCTEVPDVHRLVVCPVFDTKDMAEEVIHTSLEAYFKESRPIWNGEVFSLRVGNFSLKFKATSVAPQPYGLIRSDTVFVIGRTTVADSDDQSSLVHYSSIGGYSKQLAEIRMVFEFGLQRPQFLQNSNVRLPSSILITGPRGTGKTLVAQAIENEGEATFFQIKSKKMKLQPVDKSLRQLDETFKEAVRSSPSVIFVDDIEELASKDISELHASLTSRLIYRMDSIRDTPGVVFLAATSQDDHLDSRLKGHRYFNRRVRLGLPDTQDRHRILMTHTKGMRLSEDVDLETIAWETEGYVGADLAAVCSEAATERACELVAFTDSGTYAIGDESGEAPAVCQRHFRDAILRLSIQPKQRTDT
ncbi:cell division control protein Cdc48 [Apiospora kogelbergensis]|uniref:Cell division control protein Cdc48 n=1 Tax=Apiospora kogelbergensis TaxID=1337665 RepID=A0AAW0QJ18_9PEZI